MKGQDIIIVVIVLAIAGLGAFFFIGKAKASEVKPKTNPVPKSNMPNPALLANPWLALADPEFVRAATPVALAGISSTENIAIAGISSTENIITSGFDTAGGAFAQPFKTAENIVDTVIPW